MTPIKTDVKPRWGLYLWDKGRLNVRGKNLKTMSKFGKNFTRPVAWTDATVNRGPILAYSRVRRDSWWVAPRSPRVVRA